MYYSRFWESIKEKTHSQGYKHSGHPTVSEEGHAQCKKTEIHLRKTRSIQTALVFTSWGNGPLGGSSARKSIPNCSNDWASYGHTDSLFQHIARIILERERDVTHEFSHPSGQLARWEDVSGSHGLPQQKTQSM